MTYEEFIQNILDTRGRFACGDEYHERHHIVPKCMDGTNDDDNLIDLFAREHFEAHRLLALQYPDDKKITAAWWLMSHAKGNDNQQWYELTQEEYEEARIAFINSVSGENNYLYNRITTQCANCGKKISVTPYEYRRNEKDGEHHVFCSAECAYEHKSTYYRGERHPRYGKHFNEEQRKKMSESRKGQTAPNKGVPLSNEQKAVLSEKAKHRYEYPENHLTGPRNKLSKIINQYDGDVFICTWYGAKEIKRQTGIDDTQIIGCCKKKKGYRTAGGFKWYYADDPEQPDKSKIITQQNG